MAVMVRSGSAAHPSNCIRLLCSQYPRGTRNIFLEKLKCVAQAYTTGRLTRSNAFARSSTKATAPTSSSSAPYLNLSISIKIFAKLSAELLHVGHPWRPNQCRYFCCHFATSCALRCFPPTDQRRHKRNRPLTRDISSESRRTSLCKLVAAIFLLVPHFRSHSTIFSPCLFRQVYMGILGVEAIASYSCFLPISKFFQLRTQLALVGLPLSSSIPHFSKICPPNFAHSHYTANVLPTLSSLLHNCPTTLHLLLSPGSVLLLSM